jgi:long-subunit fatty acid transport protein
MTIKEIKFEQPIEAIFLWRLSGGFNWNFDENQDSALGIYYEVIESKSVEQNKQLDIILEEINNRLKNADEYE